MIDRHAISANSRQCRLLGIVIASLLLVSLVHAQDANTGQGGIIVESNLGDDPMTFNPIIGKDAASRRVYEWMYPDLIALDPLTLLPTPNAPHGVATNWYYDETGTLLTLELRRDMVWSDGEPITAADYLWAYYAIQSGLSSSPHTSVLYQLEDGTVPGGAIHDITALDDFTIAVRLGTLQTDEANQPITHADGTFALVPDCEALHDVRQIPVVPAHAYTAAFGTDYASMDEQPYFVPRSENGIATYGTFTNPILAPGSHVSLTADPQYPDAINDNDTVVPAGWRYVRITDTAQEYERFLAGELTFIRVNTHDQNRLRGDDRFQVIDYPASGYIWMAYNLADPANPQPGVNANGERINQGIHPIFGDVRVRQALAHAVNVEAMIGSHPVDDELGTGILAGNGYRVATHNHPGLSRTDDELAERGVAPYAYDVERAVSMLVAAGWVDTDADGILECDGCLYAATVDEDFAGTEFEFTLMTNTGGTLREVVSESIRQQLAEIGIVVNVQARSFASVIDTFLAQGFDAVLLGWQLPLPFTPDMQWNFGVSSDQPGTSLNAGSFYNAEFEAVLALAKALPADAVGTHAACDPDVRDDLYARAQEIIWEEQPYLFLFAGNTMIAAQSTVRGWNPLPYHVDWNIDAWYIEQD